jgi:citrate lyase beta subunit
MKTTLTPQILAPILESVSSANAAHERLFPGDSVERQPVHTVYGGAHLFRTETATKFGSIALDMMRKFAPDSTTLEQCVGSPLPSAVYERVLAKLDREPVEDYRIDFEDGYGNRSDAEEDGHALSTAQAVARGGKGLPPFIGIRIKPLTEVLRARSIRTLDLFLTALISESGGVPQTFVVTLPKITSPEQVTALVRLLEAMETAHGLAPLKLELMIETPQSVIDSSGGFAIPKLLDAAEGRCRGLHFGPYDYTASCNIISEHQTLVHPACDFARHVMQVSSVGRGVMLSDGPTNVLPIAKQGREVVHRAMRLHFEHVQRSLMHGYYQSWDLHPGQLPTRYAAVYAFFLQSLESTATRLRNFIDKAAQATLVGDVFDDAATGQGLLNFFIRGINCGALTEDDARTSGLTLEELRGRSFVKILDNRRSQVREIAK